MACTAWCRCPSRRIQADTDRTPTVHTVLVREGAWGALVTHRGPIPRIFPENDPAPQSWQVALLVCAGSSEKVPARHAVQGTSPTSVLKYPSAHGLQPPAPSGAYPATQVQLDAFVAPAAE
eukprot:3456362-Rhodomonas_salina.3